VATFVKKKETKFIIAECRNPPPTPLLVAKAKFSFILCNTNDKKNKVKKKNKKISSIHNITTSALVRLLIFRSNMKTDSTASISSILT